MTPEQIKALAKQAGGATTHTTMGDRLTIFLPDALAEFVRLVRDAALEKIKAPVPEGYQLVPVEPTDAMCEAAWECEGVDYVGEYMRIHRADLAYKAMLEAAKEIK